MKTLLLSLVFIGKLYVSAMAYSVPQFWGDLIKDTKQLYEQRPVIKGNYYYDVLAEGEARSKVGASLPVVAWKFVTVDPAFLYTPTDSKQVGEYGLSFSIRLSRVPLGDDFTIGDMFDGNTPEWLKRFHLGPFLSQNLQTGKFGFGVQTGVKRKPQIRLKLHRPK